MATLKPHLTSKVKRRLIPSAGRDADNQGMLDPKKLARRLVESMDRAIPPVSSSSLARACHVTPQAVNGWRTDGLISKKHLHTIARETGRPLEYFLLDAEPLGANEARSTYEDRHLSAVIAQWQYLMPEEQQWLTDEVNKKAEHNRAVASRIGNAA